MLSQQVGIGAEVCLRSVYIMYRLPGILVSALAPAWFPSFVFGAFSKRKCQMTS